MTETEIREEIDTLERRLFMHRMKDHYSPGDYDYEEQLQRRIQTYARMLKGMTEADK